MTPTVPRPVMPLPDVPAVVEPRSAAPAADPDDTRFAASAPRDVGGGLVTSPVAVDPAPLERLPAVLPPEPPRPVPEKPERPQRPERHPLVVAENAGVLMAGDTEIRLEGIMPTDPARTCSAPGGQWPCGMAARTALRAFLRSRAVVCIPRPEGVSTCTVGGRDIAAWLAEQGWAEAEKGSAYAQATEAARAAGRGLFGSGR